MSGWNWNPLHDIAHANDDLKSVLVGKAGTPGLHLFTSGGGSSNAPPSSSAAPGTAWGEPAAPSSKTSPIDYINQYLSATGAPSSVTGQQVYSYLAARDPKSLSSADALQQALNQYSTYAGWGAPGSSSGTASNSASVIDPLAVQMFFQQTIAPYLNQVAGSEKATADELRSQPMVSGLPPAYAATVKQGEQTQAADMDMLQQATLAAGATQPQVALLNQMLGLAQKASLQDYYRQLAAGIGGAGAAAPPSGGF